MKQNQTQKCHKNAYIARNAPARAIGSGHGLVLVRPLPHEKLDVFNVAIELVEMVSQLPKARGQASAHDQVKRASQSIALNIAEACGKEGKERARFFSIARGSALETAAGLRVMVAVRILSQSKYEEGHRLCGRLYAMLTRLCR